MESRRQCSGGENRYGLGVIIRKTSLGTTYGHSGFFPGYMTDMMYFPDQKVAVAVQVNTSVGRSLGKPLGRVVIEAMEVIRAAQNSSGPQGRQLNSHDREVVDHSAKKLRGPKDRHSHSLSALPASLFFR